MPSFPGHAQVWNFDDVQGDRYLSFNKNLKNTKDMLKVFVLGTRGRCFK